MTKTQVPGGEIKLLTVTDVADAKGTPRGARAKEEQPDQDKVNEQKAHT